MLIELLKTYISMTKPRIVAMVAVTAAWGYFLAARSDFNWLTFTCLMIGVMLSAAGGAVLNNYLERDLDSEMNRTRGRALPTGQVKPMSALLFGLYLVMAGLGFLLGQVNLLTAFLVLFTNFLYVLVYTPMKRFSTLNTTVGAIPGAIPPLAGWTAATGEMGIEGVVLFFLLFVWQHPHFYAIAWMYRDDYARAGFQMVSVDDKHGIRTSWYVVIGSVALIAASVLPFVIHLSSMVYLVSALIMGVGMLLASIVMLRSRSFDSAKLVLKVSVLYLPLLLVVIIVDAFINAS